MKSAKIQSTVSMFGSDQESCDDVYDQVSYNECEAVNAREVEFIEEYKLELDEVNQDNYSPNECGYLSTEGDQTDRISDRVTPLEDAIIDTANATGTKRPSKSMTQKTTGPDENDHQAETVQSDVTLRRQCTVHYSHYIHNVVPHYSDEEFVLNFRMGRNTVQMLYDHLAATSAYRKLRGHGGYEAISPQTHVLAFLWFLGHDKTSYRDVADQFSLSVSCLHSVICRVADAVLAMKTRLMVRPDEDKKAESASAFATICNISDVIGCVGGTQIKIDKPTENAERYRLYKGHHSIQLQAIIDENFRFVDIFVDYPGEPELKEAIKDICGEQYCLVGTTAYPCMYQLLVPYRSDGIPLIAAKKMFNEQLETVTNKCDHMFAQLKTRFRQLYHLKGRHLSRIVKLIKACCILHNLASDEELKLLARNDRDNHLREFNITYAPKHQSETDILHRPQRRDRISSGCM